ncbi:MAG TPA: hypothetical protein VFT84_01435 [Gemmatimonadales bacterium]|nr:hypothetical protein [Gemmatimonadales bacterium]
MFDGLKARLDRLFRERGPAAREYAAGLREALLEARVGITGMRDALARTERELVAERKQLADAERRGKLAAQVPDVETVSVAERYASRHRERVLVLERKLEVQREELALAEREVAEMAAQYKGAARGPEAASVEAAWRDLEAAGSARPVSDDDRLAADADRRMKEEAVEAQLAYLKRKMGKGQ